MFLTVHSAIGIAIGQNISNPLFAFISGFILHYIFDIIPHGDTNVSPKYKNPIHIATAGIIDLIILAIYFIFLLFSQVHLLTISIIAAVIGSIIPDILQAFYYAISRKLFYRWQKFHTLIHDAISQKYELNFFLGLIFQIIILIIFTLIII